MQIGRVKADWLVLGLILHADAVNHSVAGQVELSGPPQRRKPSKSAAKRLDNLRNSPKSSMAALNVQPVTNILN